MRGQHNRGTWWERCKSKKGGRGIVENKHNHGFVKEKEKKGPLMATKMKWGLVWRTGGVAGKRR